MLEDSPMRRSAIGLILSLALGFLVTLLCSNAQQPVKLIGTRGWSHSF